MLYIVNEMTFNGYNVYSLDLLYLIAILLGIFVIISKNPIISLLCKDWRHLLADSLCGAQIP